jgi:hypothetical protein
MNFKGLQRCRPFYFWGMSGLCPATSAPPGAMVAEEQSGGLWARIWTTLIDKPLGLWWSPRQILREGKAETQVHVQRALMLAQAEKDVAAIREGKLWLASDG